MVYTKDGKLLQQFDYTKEANEKEFTVAVCSPSGQTVVIGSYNR
jgi:intraflagellar transport protein 172